MTTLGVLAHSKKTLEGGVNRLRGSLADRGHRDILWREVSKSKHASTAARELLESGVDRLLVWGGDGTVRRCIDAIVERESRVEVAVLPAGTANLLAHGLGVPVNLEGALDVALQGHVRRIDIGVMNGEHFAVMAGTGFDALLIRDAEDSKDRLGRLAYVRAAVSHLTEPNTRVTIEIDGKPWFDGPAACVLVGNMGRVFGGLELFPGSRPDDGVLDVGVVTAERRLDWMRVGLRAAVGRIDSSPLVDATRATKVKVRLARKLPWEMDGGDRPATRKLDVRVLPARIPVCVPAA